MPIVSQRQKRAMYAARAGHSTLGIPASVGRKFIEHDGVILPARDYDDAAQIHGRPRVLAPFEKRSVLQRAKERMRDDP